MNSAWCHLFRGNPWEDLYGRSFWETLSISEFPKLSAFPSSYAVHHWLELRLAHCKFRSIDDVISELIWLHLLQLLHCFSFCLRCLVAAFILGFDLNNIELAGLLDNHKVGGIAVIPLALAHVLEVKATFVERGPEKI